MGRKQRLNNQGFGGGYLSEAVEGPNLNERVPRSHTSANNTLNATYGIQQQHAALRGKDKVRGGSLSYANHKYNQSASGIKRGSTAPSSQHQALNRNDMGLSYAIRSRPPGIAPPFFDGTNNTQMPGAIRQQQNVSSDLSLGQQVLQQKYKPRAISSTVAKNMTNKKVKLQQTRTPIFQSNYLEQQQPKIKNKLQTLMGEGFGKPVVPVHDVDGQPFQQFEQWQRPPSRQKEPNRAQNLDDLNPKYSDRQSLKMQAQIHAGQQINNAMCQYPQFELKNILENGMRPRIDFFHQRITGSSEFANQYAAMNYNQMRPPSRHKEVPQGLELPPQNTGEPEEDIPSVDEDSDSLLEFEIGLQNAQSQAKQRKSKKGGEGAAEKRSPKEKKVGPFAGPQGLNRDSSEDEGEPQNYESEIQFTENPILKDFFNLSNGGSRFIKANQESRRHTTGLPYPGSGLSSQSKIYASGPNSNNSNVNQAATFDPPRTMGIETNVPQKNIASDQLNFQNQVHPSQQNTFNMTNGNNKVISNQAHVADAYDGSRQKPKSAAGNRMVRDKNRIRAAIASGGNANNNAMQQQQLPPGTAPANLSGDKNGNTSLASTGGRKKFVGQPLGKGGWPKEDPLHDPPVSIDFFLQPVVGTDKQHSGAKTTFHTHQHSLMGVEYHINKRLPDEDNTQAMEMSGFLGRQSSYNGGGAKVVVPQTSSSSQMIFGKRPPEARGKRNKILSAGGSSNTFYKSAMLNNNPNRTGNGVAPEVTDGVSTNLNEFCSPRPINNNGVGELLPKAVEKDGFAATEPTGKSTHHIMFTMTGKHDLHGEETALSDDNELSSLIASTNMQNIGGFKSQTLQFQTALGNDFLDLFAREEGDEDEDEA